MTTNDNDSPTQHKTMIDVNNHVPDSAAATSNEAQANAVSAFTTYWAVFNPNQQRRPDFQTTATHHDHDGAEPQRQQFRPTSRNPSDRHISLPGIACNQVAAAPMLMDRKVADWNEQASQKQKSREELLERMASRRISRGSGDQSLRPAKKSKIQPKSREELLKMMARRRSAREDGDQSSRSTKRAKIQHFFSPRMNSSSLDATNSIGVQTHHSANYRTQVEVEKILQISKSVSKTNPANSCSKTNNGTLQPQPKPCLERSKEANHLGTTRFRQNVMRDHNSRDCPDLQNNRVQSGITPTAGVRNNHDNVVGGEKRHPSCRAPKVATRGDTLGKNDITHYSSIGAGHDSNAGRGCEPFVDDKGVNFASRKASHYASLGSDESIPSTSSFRASHNQPRRPRVEENQLRLKSCLNSSNEKPVIKEREDPIVVHESTAEAESIVDFSNNYGEAECYNANEAGKGTSNMMVGSVEKKDDSTKNPTNTHVLFAIDFSSSMKKKDVRTSKNKKISRWEAVFECVDSLLTQQLYQQEESCTMSTCLVSVLIFNDNSEVILNRMPLVGKGNDVRAALNEAKVNHTPQGGTGFSAGFQEAERLTRSHDDKVILVFLSDGRPGDLCHRPPTIPRIPIQKKLKPMQTTFKRNGVTFPAAGCHIDKMQKRHSDFSLQLICLYDQGAEWLKYLAGQYNGTFHNPDLTLDDAACRLGHAQGDCVDSGEGEDVEIVNVKSQEALISERYQKAKMAGEIVSLTSTTRASSMRSTFSSISATVTAMRSSTKLQERAVTIKTESTMISYIATRMVLKLDANGVDKFVVAPGESANGRRIGVSMNPFAQGGLRNVYRMKQKSERLQCAKESRHDIAYHERLKFHVETVKCQTKASLYANRFNKKIKDLKKKEQKGSLVDVPPLHVLRAEVYRLKAPSCPGGFRYLAVENHLDGSYEKWNNNDGFVAHSDCIKCKVAQAFSHFSYESSQQRQMVVDIQGSGNSSKCRYTDPQLHSVHKEFGRADRGTVGIDKFFATHKCNFICRELGLPQRSGI